MTLAYDLYWSFRSPYSWLANDRYRAMTGANDLEIDVKPVYPLAIRQPDFFDRNHPNWLAYTFRDVVRLAQLHGIPLAAPRPDPIVQDLATRQIAAEQPYIRRLVRLGQAAARRGHSVVFCAEVARLIWGGTENWRNAISYLRMSFTRCASSIQSSEWKRSLKFSSVNQGLNCAWVDLLLMLAYNTRGYVSCGVGQS